LAEFKYRATSVWALPILGSVLGGYASYEVIASGTNTSGSISGDLIVGAIRFIPTRVPCSYLSYLNANVTASKQLGSVANTDVTKIDYKGSAGFILTSYIRIDERTPSGQTVRSVKLRDLVWTVAAGSSNGGLHYLTVDADVTNFFTKLHLKSGEVLSFTFVISEVLGEVTFGSVTVPVTPKALESIVEINGWNYQSIANNLVLVTGVATGSAAGSSTGTVTLASGSGDNQVYADFSKTVDVSGSLKSVDVKTTIVTDFNLVTDDVDIVASASSVYNGSYTLANVEVAFPAGKAKITYDPTIGSGTPITNYKNGANTVLIFSLLLSLVVLLI